MGVKSFLYSVGYRYFRAPWDGGGPRAELVELVESGRIKPCRAIDLGSGTAWNVIFMAQHGFEATGVDFAPGAIELGRSRAQDAGVTATFVEDDLTNLQHVNGVFDLLVDYGTFDDLSLKERALYVKNVLPLTQPGSIFLLFCFEWPPRWWERPFFDHMALEPGAVDRRFSEYFEIERYSGTEKPNFSQWPPGYATYLMTRNQEKPI
jgi:ubiquinone/menaquinone biosynthesis C-methylase UbiE